MKHPLRYRVVYGETLPMWAQSFAAKRAAESFALRQLSRGDIIFTVAKIVPGETRQSLEDNFGRALFLGRPR
jgi:hypothetical protein